MIKYIDHRNNDSVCITIGSESLPLPLSCSHHRQLTHSFPLLHSTDILNWGVFNPISWNMVSKKRRVGIK